MRKQQFTCLECGKVFQRYASTMHNPEKPYCSKACVGKSKRHGSQLYCAMCDSAFYRRFGEQDLGEKVSQFCSKRCYADWRAINAKPNTYLKTGSRHTHRVVAEQILGRPLTADEVVHHIDEDKHNNNPSNLAVFPDQAHHARCHFGDMSHAELLRFSLIQES